jgi:prophage DNA circulation protein
MQKLQAYTGTLNTANDELKRERSLVQERTVCVSISLNSWWLIRKASNTQAISQLQLKISSTRGRLVQSPDRIKRTISEMSTNLSHEKTTLSEHQRKTRELQNRLDIITNLERDLRDLIELSRAIHDRKVKLSEAERAKSGTIGNLEGKRIESESLEASLAVCTISPHSYREGRLTW